MISQTWLTQNILIKWIYFMSSNQSTFSSNSEVKVLTQQSNHESNDARTAMIPMYRLIVITILAAFLLTLTSWWAIDTIKSEIQKEMGKSLVTVLDTTHQAINSWTKEHRAATQIWANSPELILLTEELLAIQERGESLINTTVQSTVNNWLDPVYSGKGYQGFFIIGPDNINLASTRNNNIGVTNLLTQQPYVIEKLWSGETAISLPQVSDVPLPDSKGIMREGMPTMFVGAPIRNQKGNIIAILTFRINPAADFTAIFQRGRIGISGETYAFNKHGLLISESRFDEQLRSIDLIDQDAHAILNVAIRDPGINLVDAKNSMSSEIQQPLTLMAKNAVAGESGMNLEGYRDYRGVPVIGAWTWDNDLGFGFTTEIDVAEAYDVLGSIRIVILAITIITIGLLICLAAIFLWNRNRIAQINEGLEKRVAERTRKLSAEVARRKQVEQEILAARESAETANRAKSQFLASMSHELRTPLNAIIGYGEMLREEAEDLEQEIFGEDLKKICLAGRHLLGLINNILDLSKIEAGKTELIMEFFDVAELIEEVTSTVRQLVEKNGNSLEVSSLDGLGRMKTDQTKLRQILINLLSNAGKFTREGRIILTVGKESVDGRDWMTFAVCDTGVGMDEAQLNRIFLEFGQAERSTTNQYGGTGLGLTISRKFCQLMYGGISVRSAPGEGSTFTVRLPARVRAVPRATGAKVVEETGVPVGKGPLVLVIDDDVDSRKLLGQWLLQAGFQVVTAEDGPTGLAIARQLKPVAITLDVLMPGIGGWEMLQALKSEPELSAIPVVMCTVVDEKERGFALGVTEYLTKPIDRDQLLRTLKRIRPHGDGHVLLVDDEQLDRQIICRELTKAGWQVREAENGRVALELLQDGPADLILLDLQMPEMDGFEFVEALQANTLWRAIPILVLTSRDLSNADRLRLDAYVQVIMEKGEYGMNHVIRELYTVLRQQKSRDKQVDSVSV
jgi:signal transduction histidine kinase/DNA-binding response OmpR family regulator